MSDVGRLMGLRPLCVFCRRHPVDPRWRPFCSERCKLQDLARWADGTYRVPANRWRNPTEDDIEDSSNV